MTSGAVRVLCLGQPATQGRDESMADNTTGQTPTGRWPVLSAREVSCLAAGVVLIVAG